MTEPDPKPDDDRPKIPAEPEVPVDPPFIPAPTHPDDPGIEPVFVE